MKRAPVAPPEVAPAPAAPSPQPGAELGGESTLERELGSAFESAFGGGSAGLAAEAQAQAQPQAQRPELELELTAPAPAPAPVANPPEAPGAEAVSDWYVALNDEQVGPLEAPAVKKRWESGEVGPDTLAWRPGMADWVAISSIPEMAHYLAPVPRSEGKGPLRPVAATPSQSREPAPGSDDQASIAKGEAGASSTGAAAKTPAPSAQLLNGVNGAGFKPSAASALAALASEEMSGLQRPEPKAESAPAVKAGSLVERMDLPDGGVDPTNFMPLPIKGLDPTGESSLKTRAPAPAPAATPRAGAGGGRNVLAIAVALFVVFGGGLAVALYAMRQGPPPLAGAAQPRIEAPAPAAGPAAAQAQAPAADTTSNPSTAPDPNPSPALPPTAAPPQAVASAPPPTSGESEVQAPSPAHEPPAPAARPTRRPKREAVAKREEVAPPLTRKQRRERVAAAERAPEPEPAAPTPAPEPPRRKPAGDPLLDVGDDDLEKELAAGPKPKRSVYVPPAPGSDLPDSVSVSQINEAVVGQKAALLRCIDQQKAADPDTKGTLRMRWVIAGDGSARDVRVVSDEFSRQPIAPCITAVVKSLRFPRSRTSGQEVVFPFKF